MRSAPLPALTAALPDDRLRDYAAAVAAANHPAAPQRMPDRLPIAPTPDRR
jgi:hypothetical protein